ncbi:hypothetical protein SAMN05216480_11853 [Pustulibacterium marinum]|uniref:Uncharacterized protein n=1 Tax=Pustulibacterium marinum TaxID=1224947 RepID=A0A1I7INL1_9FLAO|nr:hypothetical protein [Pustulibacterium marinum]SFU74533.1 hypothetical protein SAMN05216480_11853 [Pustulibacterium marinum]
MKKILSLLLVIFTVWVGQAQCTDCTGADITLTSANNADYYTFLPNKTYCISGTVTFNYTVTFGNNVTICIPSGAVLACGNGWASTGNQSSNAVTFNVSGKLYAPNAIPFSPTLNIFNGGVFTGTNNSQWQDFDFNGDTLDINVSSGGTIACKQFLLSDTDIANIVNEGSITLYYSDLSVGGCLLNLTNSGELSIGGNFNIGSNSGTNIVNNTGKLTISGEMNSQSTKLELYNYGDGELVMTSNMTYGSNGPNKFENYGTFSCNGLYSTDPTLHMKNEGDMSTHANYDDTVGSFFSNCGTLHMSQNWANLQGTIINTGDMTVVQSSVAFASTGSIENYSTMSLQGITMGSGGIFYNEGYVEFTSSAVYDVKLYGPGSSNQPTHSTSTNYGQFVMYGTSNGPAVLKGNLNFLNNNGSSTQAGCFGTVSDMDSTVTFGTCASCTVVTDYDQCANADGTWPEVESPINMIPVNRNIRSYFQ